MEKEKKIIYYKNELEDEFSEAQITAKRIDGTYKYKCGVLRSITRFFLYHILAKVLLFIYLKVWYGHKIVNKQCIKKGNYTGFFMYGNHTNAIADALIPTRVCNPLGAYVIVHANNVSMPVLGHITPCLGAIPLPDDKEAMKNFNKEMERLIKKNKRIVIYPEAHIWPYYTGIINFNDRSFLYPAQLEVPVFCFTNTYQKRKWRATPRIVTYVDGPFYPDKGLSLREQKQQLHEKVIATMKERCKNSNVELIQYVRKEEL